MIEFNICLFVFGQIVGIVQKCTKYYKLNILSSVVCRFKQISFYIQQIDQFDNFRKYYSVNDVFAFDHFQFQQNENHAMIQYFRQFAVVSMSFSRKVFQMVNGDIETVEIRMFFLNENLLESCCQCPLDTNQLMKFYIDFSIP